MFFHGCQFSSLDDASILQIGALTLLLDQVEDGVIALEVLFVRADDTPHFDRAVADVLKLQLDVEALDDGHHVERVPARHRRSCRSCCG